MREILFRGRSTNNKWKYGCLYETSIRYHKISELYILPKAILYRTYSDGDEMRSVYAAYQIKNIDTVGQYTGVNDKNEVKIFEGDIIKYHEDNINYIAGYVVYKDCSFYVKGVSYWEDSRLDNLEEDTTIEVVGNIYDNPGLLEL